MVEMFVMVEMVITVVMIVMVEMVIMVKMVIMVIIVIMIRSGQDRTGQTGQAKLAFKLDFPGNLCQAAFLRCVLH